MANRSEQRRPVTKSDEQWRIEANRAGEGGGGGGGGGGILTNDRNLVPSISNQFNLAAISAGIGFFRKKQNERCS